MKHFGASLTLNASYSLFSQSPVAKQHSVVLLCRLPTSLSSNRCEHVNVGYNIVDWRSTREPTKKAGHLTCFFRWVTPTISNFKYQDLLNTLGNTLIKSSSVTFIKKARLEFRGSLTSDTQAELKYVVLEVCKAISQKLRKGTRFCFNSLAHTATTLESTFPVLTVRTVTTSAHLQGVRKGFDLCFISDGSIKEISKGKAWVVRF